MIVLAGSRWQTRDGADGLAPPRFGLVECVEPGKWNFDRGQNAGWPPDDVTFVFDDGQRTKVGVSAFLRTVVPA